MKKLIIAAILVIVAGGALNAQNRQAPNNKNNPGYVDANRNATCDNYEKRTCQLSNTPAARGGNRRNAGCQRNRQNNTGKGIRICRRW